MREGVETEGVLVRGVFCCLGVIEGGVSAIVCAEKKRKREGFDEVAGGIW